MDTIASMTPPLPVRYRTLFLSDIHLASRACRAMELAAFLRAHDAETIFLVGDVIDFWKIRRRPYWRYPETAVLTLLLAKAQAGTRVVYIPGNHDNEMRAFAGTRLGQLEIRLRDIHTTASGRRFLVIHGDEFDMVMIKARWLAVLGDIGYDIALASNSVVNLARRAFGLPYWSLSAFLKHRVKQAVSYIGKFETLLTEAAKQEGVEGVICGHIHYADMRDVNGIAYVNTGDWVESCTAVAEHADGRLEIVRWTMPQMVTRRLS